jgi:hypothetical protein
MSFLSGRPVLLLRCRSGELHTHLSRHTVSNLSFAGHR